jgi:hypothetical protein
MDRAYWHVTLVSVHSSPTLIVADVELSMTNLSLQSYSNVAVPEGHLDFSIAPVGLYLTQGPGTASVVAAGTGDVPLAATGIPNTHPINARAQVVFIGERI